MLNKELTDEARPAECHSDGCATQNRFIAAHQLSTKTSLLIVYKDTVLQTSSFYLLHLRNKRTLHL